MPPVDESATVQARGTEKSFTAGVVDDNAIARSGQSCRGAPQPTVVRINGDIETRSKLAAYGDGWSRTARSGTKLVSTTSIRRSRGKTLIAGILLAILQALRNSRHDQRRPLADKVEVGFAIGLQ